MIYEFIAIGIIVICIVSIVIIITKKFPILAAINITALQKYKQDKIKKGLIEDRLKRKFKAFSFRALFKSGSEKPRSPIFENFYKYLKILEQRYRDKIRTREPEERETAEKKKIILLSEAKKLFEEAKFKEAEDKYIETISLDSKYIEAYEGLAETYFKIKDFEHTKEIYGYLIKMNAQDSSKKEDQREISLKEGINEKEKDYSQSTSLSNQVARHQVDLGEVFMATEEYEKALGCFQEAVKLEPNNPRNLDAIIGVAVKLEDKILAREYYNKLKEVNPENEKLKDISGVIKALTKK
jgi:tetratricopeptide (TPR) repeat protein